MVGGGGGWWLRPILVFSLSLDQAEQFQKLNQNIGNDDFWKSFNFQKNFLEYDFQKLQLSKQIGN